MVVCVCVYVGMYVSVCVYVSCILCVMYCVLCVTYIYVCVCICVCACVHFIYVCFRLLSVVCCMLCVECVYVCVCMYVYVYVRFMCKCVFFVCVFSVVGRCMLCVVHVWYVSTSLFIPSPSLFSLSFSLFLSPSLSLSLRKSQEHVKGCTCIIKCDQLHIVGNQG